MRVVIIEDEYPAADRLQGLLKKIDPGMSVLQVLESVSSALQWFSEQATPPDLIFSDIQLSDGLSFEIYESLQVRCPIIFTTAYDEYAIKAFKVKSIDYLLKPIKQGELAAALEKYYDLREDFSPVQSQANIESLLEILKAPPTQESYKSRFLVMGHDQLIPVPVEEIAYFYTTQDIVYLVKRDGRRHAVDFKMEQLIELLDPSQFYRLNRQYLCHLAAIRSIHPYFNGRLKLVLQPDPNEDVIVSRERARSFKSWLGE
jgi:DNA-binding LytR/AlgR family response regulator